MRPLDGIGLPPSMVGAAMGVVAVLGVGAGLLIGAPTDESSGAETATMSPAATVPGEPVLSTTARLSSLRCITSGEVIVPAGPAVVAGIRGAGVDKLATILGRQPILVEFVDLNDDDLRSDFEQAIHKYESGILVVQAGNRQERIANNLPDGWLTIVVLAASASDLGEHAQAVGVQTDAEDVTTASLDDDTARQLATMVNAGAITCEPPQERSNP